MCVLALITAGFSVSMHVWTCVFLTSYLHLVLRVCECIHMCIRLSDMPVQCVCAWPSRGVEGLAQPPDGGYCSCLAPSLINFFPYWLWLLINKTWSGDQMQISWRGGGGVERGCWLLSQICLFLAPLPSTLDWRAAKGQDRFFPLLFLEHMLTRDGLSFIGIIKSDSWTSYQDLWHIKLI